MGDIMSINIPYREISFITLVLVYFWVKKGTQRNHRNSQWMQAMPEGFNDIQVPEKDLACKDLSGNHAALQQTTGCIANPLMQALSIHPCSPISVKPCLLWLETGKDTLQKKRAHSLSVRSHTLAPNSHLQHTQAQWGLGVGRVHISEGKLAVVSLELG